MAFTLAEHAPSSSERRAGMFILFFITERGAILGGDKEPLYFFVKDRKRGVSNKSLQLTHSSSKCNSYNDNYLN